MICDNMISRSEEYEDDYEDDYEGEDCGEDGYCTYSEVPQIWLRYLLLYLLLYLQLYLL